MLNVYIVLSSKCQENGYIQFVGVKQNFRKIRGEKGWRGHSNHFFDLPLMATALPFYVIFHTISPGSVVLMLID